MPPANPTAIRVLFVELDELDAVERAIGDTRVVEPRHRAFRGSTVREPGGNVVGFARFG